MSDGLIEHPDGKTRCWWPGTDPLYVAYHDTEWGVPEYDDRALFEKLILDGFQAGLSWITILWDFVHGRPIQNNLQSRADVQPETEVSRRMSKALKAEGFNFVGPTII